MKKFLLLIVFIPLVEMSFAQQFQKHTGIGADEASDSRSVNFVDINNDGFDDLFISNGKKGGQKDFLYINDTKGGFIKATGMDLVDVSNPSDGASFADFDNDGFIDGIVSSWYGSEDLLVKNTNGILNRHSNAGITLATFAETAVFADYDNDGLLDIYITISDGDLHNILYKNIGGSKFQRITDHVLVEDAKLSRAAIFADFNNDRLPDLFVVNESNASNDLFYNLGKGNFQKVTTGSLVTDKISSITASVADIDRDGDLDIFVGNAGYFLSVKNQLYINENGNFSSVLNDAVVAKATCTYGSTFADIDNDGDEDLIISNGFCNVGLNNILYKNNGDGTFVEAIADLGDNTQVCSFGIAASDFNNDGFVDIAVANCQNRTTSPEPNNTILINKGNTNHWIKIGLEGLVSNKNAIGARVKVKAEFSGKSVWQTKEVSAQSGYAGQNSMTLVFGLAEATKADSMIILWPSGKTDYYKDLQSDSLYKYTEQLANSTGSLYNKHKTLTLYPNPNMGLIHFEISEEISANLNEMKVTISDALGNIKKLKKEAYTFHKGKGEIRLTEMIEGMYYLIISVEDRQYASLFMKH